MIFTKNTASRSTRRLSLLPLSLLGLAIASGPGLAASDAVAPNGLTQASEQTALPSRSIRLAEALAKALELNPRLQQFPMYLRQYDLKRLIAARPPAWQLSGSVENVLGTGPFSGVDSAEITVQVQRLFERGDKAAKRASLVDAELAAEQQAYEVLKLEVLANTRRNFYQLQRLQAIQQWAKESLTEQRKALKTVQRLANAGAINQADKDKMRLQVQSSKALLENVQGELLAQSLRLQSMWLGEHASAADQAMQWHADGDDILFQVPEAQKLVEALNAAPDYLLANAQSRVAEAAWHLSQSQKQVDVNLGLGLRRFQASRDQALLLEFSMPLQQGERAQADINVSHGNWQIKQAEQARQRWQLQQRLLLLRQSLLNNREQISRIENDLLPQASRYQAAAKRAYEVGQYSLLQWLDAQIQVVDIKRQLIELRNDFRMKWIELERLSGRNLAS
ncbi:TolC family protein [Pseudoteredinibacter isoporae]|uniref:Cobalt-zinc-cadmium efflux system outer membrane protein n=1 Tax=Pseudoteredinibacter isoporae TaxID=570281 RepID=A0A7X0JUK8_9GAMM|nr:TolC family protein [Pseudoteredinibacter isoporae]MBB6522119.1 cobalt-zinc-cadmium efflux system outer membrane protein [Pseudoteredinibacter isoporae]NHO87654.1 TolC family protein [Pseudoteredinibacter isoporae]NIB24015.1 TolC family protein [Pseudoteredinibacter isoporae]